MEYSFCPLNEGQESEPRKPLEEENEKRHYKITATLEKVDHSMSKEMVATSLRDKQNVKK